MKKSIKKSAFTLIELLMVIAIIGILAGILIPSIGAVQKQVKIAASKAQISSYISAINEFKSQYSYLPFTTEAAAADGEYNINGNAVAFMETLSGRDANGASVSTGGNRRRIAFHEFNEAEFFEDDLGVTDRSRITDRFNNENIIFVIDTDGDGEITVPDPDNIGSEKTMKTNVTAYVLGVDTDDAPGAPTYYLYE